MSALAGYLRTLRQYLATPHGRHDARDDAAALARIALSCLLAAALLALARGLICAGDDGSMTERM